MDGIAAELTRRGATVLTTKRTARGTSVVFAGSAVVLRPLTIGNADAWRQLIDDNDPGDGGAITVRLDLFKNSGRVRVLSELPARHDDPSPLAPAAEPTTGTVVPDGR